MRTGPSKVDRLVLIDRDVDMATPMCTQITFEGLIDEITGIKSGSVPWNPRGEHCSRCCPASAATSVLLQLLLRLARLAG